jgi:hypothetical protein
MKNMKYIILLIALVPYLAHSQVDTLAYKQWEKLFAPMFSGEGYKVDFDCITNGKGHPLTAIKSVPNACVKGFLHLSEYKYSIDFGAVKALCDNKLVIMINEAEKIMVVDSVARYTSNENPFGTLIQDTTNKDFMSIQLETITFLNQRYKAIIARDKIQDTYTGTSLVTTYFLIDKSGEWKHWIEYRENNSEYTWFTVGDKLVDKSIVDQKIHLPKTEVNNMAGYQVMDYRFIK